MRLVFLGAPGSGKGSLAVLLKRNLDLLHIATGDILREEIKKNSSLGQTAKGYIDRGELVADELVTKLVENKIENVNHGYMLDGFPRTKKQAEDLDKILSKNNQPLDLVIYLKASLPVIVQRLSGRRVCKNCGALFHVKNKPPVKDGICDICQGVLYQRPDDNEATIQTRMDVYLNNTMPIIEYYQAQNKLKTVDGDKNSDELLTIMMPIVNENKKANQY